MPMSSMILKSNTMVLVLTAKGSSCTSSTARSLVPSRAARPPITMMVVDAKKDGLADRLCAMMPSSIRGSRATVCSIQAWR